MIRTARSGISAALLAVLAVSSFAQAAPKDIQEFYTKVAAAEEKKNLAALVSLTTPGFVLVDHHGKSYPLAQVKQIWQTQMSLMQNVRSKYIVEKATITGNTATVVTAATMTADWKDATTGKVQKLKSAGKSRDTLLKTATGWKYQKSVATSLTATLDGKPMPGL